jgi:hypothetical protein
MDRHLLVYYIGIMIVFITHILMLTQNKMVPHSIINLFAACCIAYYFMNKEGFIHF